MKALILASKLFRYELDHRTLVGEELTSKETNQYQNPLVIFICVEKKDNDEILERVARDLIIIAEKNKSKIILINPFAHLSQTLAESTKAIELLDNLTEIIGLKTEIKVERLIFGWYKQFLIDVNGHDSSQIFREY